MVGTALTPVKRLRAFSADELEDVVGWWLHHTLAGEYGNLVAYGGSGDKGRDRVGYVGALGSDPWDNYQCKQYDKKLAPADMWLEFGKLVYYVAKGDYSLPRRYVFVAPLGLGPKALDLISDPEKIRAGLLKNWDGHCGSLCPLEEINEVIAQFTFPDITAIGGETIAHDLESSPIYPVFFGGGVILPRPLEETPPEEIAAHEMPYVGHLVAAYDDHADAAITTHEAALSTEPYGSHLRESRKEFYCAESLREFSKDAFPGPETFIELQGLVHDGVKYTVARDHPTGYDRALATCEQSTIVQLGDHPLAGDATPNDRAGICHQLANEDRIRWTR